MTDDDFWSCEGSLKCGASYRIPLETTIIENKQPSLVKLCRDGLLFRNWFYKVHFVFSIFKDKPKVIMFYIAPSGRKIQKLEFPSFKSTN